MSDDNSANGLFNVIKNIVDNYLSNRQVTSVMIGVYNGSAVVINERLPLPMSMIKGNTAGQLVNGDKVVLLRNDGGREYFVMEIMGKPYGIKEDAYG
ncbi:MAG: DNA helicase [Lacrimispora sp.]|uniref:DNA helicase n=1 Tax=Lacrimispora sp. TaxID=2719234 RepID=UPI0039E4CE5B